MIEKLIYLTFIDTDLSGVYSAPSTVFGAGVIHGGRQVRHRTYRLADKRDKSFGPD